MRHEYFSSTFDVEIYSLADCESIFTIPGIVFVPDYENYSTSSSPSMQPATGSEHFYFDSRAAVHSAGPSTSEPGVCKVASSSSNSGTQMRARLVKQCNTGKSRQPTAAAPPINRFNKLNSKSTFSITSGNRANHHQSGNGLSKSFFRSFSVTNLAHLLRFGKLKSIDSINSTDSRTHSSLACTDSGLGTGSGSDEVKVSKPLEIKSFGSNELLDLSDDRRRYCKVSHSRQQPKFNGLKFFKSTLSTKSKSMGNIRSGSSPSMDSYPPMSLSGSSINDMAASATIGANSCSSILFKSSESRQLDPRALGSTHYLAKAHTVHSPPTPQMSFTYLSSL